MEREQVAMLEGHALTKPNFVGEGDARVKAMAELANRHILWHEGCEGRHGVVLGLTYAEMRTVTPMLVYYYGSRCAWQKRNPAGTYDLEFVHQTKVFPPPNRPWLWCGATVLFKDWQQRDSDRSAALRKYRVGSRVCFDHQGVHKIGLVSRVNKSTVSVVVDGEGTWRVSPNLLTPE